MPILYPPITCLRIKHICLYLSIFSSLPMKEGHFFRPSSISLGGGVLNTPLQVNSWHVASILTSVQCGEKICALLCSMVAGGVVLCEIVYQILLSSHPIYQKFSLPDSISDAVRSHVDSSWMLLADVVIGKSISCRADLSLLGWVAGRGPFQWVPFTLLHLYNSLQKCL